MLALVDADLIAYEASAAAGMVDDDKDIRSFDYVMDYIDHTLDGILEAVGTDVPPVLYLTGDGNFRFDIATVKPYKGNRNNKPKPFHLPAARKYLEVQYGAIVVHGMEADDALAIEATKHSPDDVCICSRDKDLRQVPCWQYSWESGKQPEWGPELVDFLGELKATFVDKTLKNGEPSKAIRKLSGTGMRWFYAQCITGDTTDNIPGLVGKGAGLAYELLRDAPSEEELHARVLGAYQDKYAEDAYERLLEQGQLLWMCRELDDEGNPVMWEV